MWPFRRKKIANRLGAIVAGEVAEVELLASVVSPNVVISPVSGMRSALVQIELLERISVDQGGGASLADNRSYDRFASLGSAILGELLALRDADGDEISVVASRARFDVGTPRNGGTPIASVPAELVPFLRRASGRGIVCYREFPLLEGDKVRLRAIVEPSQSVVTSGYRSGSKLRYVVRDDLAVVVLEEVFEPDW